MPSFSGSFIVLGSVLGAFTYEPTSPYEGPVAAPVITLPAFHRQGI